MSRFAFTSIRWKLIAAIAVLSLGPLAGFYGLAARETGAELEATAGQALSSAAQSTAARLAAYIHERLGDVSAFTANPLTVDGSAAVLGDLADRYASVFTEYDLIVIADRDGKVIATNSATGDKKPVDRAAIVGQSVRGQAWFDQIQSGAIARGTASLTDVALDPMLAAVTHGRGQAMIVSIGLYDKAGQLVRVWSNHVSWARSLGDITHGALALLHTAGIKTGGIELIDRAGLVIDDENDDDNMKHNLVQAKAAYAQTAVAGGTGYVRARDVTDNTDDVIGYASLAEHGDFKANGWAVLVHQDASEVAAMAHGFHRFALIVLLLSGAIVVVGGLLIARAITRSLLGNVATLERVADGDLTARAEVKGRDELARMATATNATIDRLSAAFASIQDTAGSLSRASESLSGIGAALGTSADGTSRQAGIVASASEQAGKNVQTVATGTEEMSVTIKEIAKNAASAARVATSAVTSAHRTNELVAKLGDSSTEIGNVLKVITSIAEQTNLLALNATIEAARAGEAGKGFAVVANEVKELAKETAKATEDITRKIEAIQADTHSAIDAIGEITQVIGQINDIQSTIASSVEEQAATTNEMGRNLHELAQASNEIAQNVTMVATAASDTAACSTQTRDAASQLSDLSRSLEGQLSQFHFDRAGRPPVTSAPAPRVQTGTLVRVPHPSTRIPVVTGGSSRVVPNSKFRA